MKAKLLLFLICLLGLGVLSQAQTKKPYNNLIITEARINATPFNYIEFTNMGTETIDLSNFEFGTIGPWTQPFTADANNHFMLPAKQLAPGASFVIAVGSDFEPENWLRDPLHYSERITKPEMWKLADMILHRKEPNSNANDSITPKWNTMDTWNGRDCWYLRHHYLNDQGQKDSMIIDQVGGIFDEADGTSADKAHDVAGVLNATNTCVLVRKASITTGLTEFSSTEANADAAKLQFKNAAGLDLEDSEWIPVPILGVNNDYRSEPWRAVFWTVGNQVHAVLDENTLTPKNNKVVVDLNASTITIPWGIRRDDSIMYQFDRKPGLAWKYDYVASSADSAYISARTGDKLTLYVCGDQATIKEFTINVLPPTNDDNIVIPKNEFNYVTMFYNDLLLPYSGYRVTQGIPGMDTINHIDYATRVDTLFKYLEKAPQATWEIVFKDGVEKPDLTNGDILRVTSQSGQHKDYFLKLEKFIPSADAYLSSITWPDMPDWFKGDIAASYGWKGDTIPGFLPSKNEYVVTIPKDYDAIPALVFHKQQLDSKVEVKRATSLNWTPEDRTMTFTVTAENDTTINVYHVRFEKEKEDVNVQPFIADPFISQLVFQDEWNNPWLEIMNPGTAPLDLSHYMFVAGYITPAQALTSFNEINATDTYQAIAYRKYVPGKKWQDEASFTVQPRILEPDLAINPIVMPGDVFVMTQHGDGGTLPTYGNEVDVNFATGKNPWGFDMPWGNAIHEWSGGTFYMFKILNDSVVNGLKPATDPEDFELIETFGNGVGTDWVIGGEQVQQITSYFRKPNIYKGNPELAGSFGTTKENSEWYWTNQAYYQALNYGWPEQIYRVVDGIGSHIMNDITVYRSTVSSKVYKVSPGYSENETIKGLTTGTTVSTFYQNILKADPLQTLNVVAATTGNNLADADMITNGDTLVVLSADSTNTSKYVLEVTQQGLSANATLTSTKYTIEVTGTTGTIAGFNKNTLLKDVVAGVNVPAGATMTVVDQNDAYMSLRKLNYDSAYVDVLATDQVYFEVIAENGTTKVLYQLKPTTTASEAYVTSDIYHVDQQAYVIQYVPVGTSVTSLLANVTPAPGATMKVYDKAGFERTSGDVYRDDKLLVVSADNTNSTAYYFSMLNYNANLYFAFVTSNDYTVNQVNHLILGPALGTSIAEFVGKLYPSFGATMKVVGQDGTEHTGNLATGDALLVTAADGVTTATYKIQGVTDASVQASALIRMYPNPTTGKVIVQGLAKGNRVQVYNAAGVVLHNVIVDNATDFVSLQSQPAGIYIFIVSDGAQRINIQKIVKK
jgi:hypothetical protein